MPRKKKPKPAPDNPHGGFHAEFGADHLRERLALMKGIIPRRAVRKDCSSYHFTINQDGTAIVAATDLEVRLRLRLEVLGRYGHGTIMVEARALDALLGAYAEPRVRLHLDDPTKVGVGSIQTHLELPGHDPATHLNATAEGSLTSTGWMVRGADLAAALEHTRRTTDPKSTRYALNGVALVFPEEEGKPLELVSTDGRRIGLYRVPVKPHGDSPDRLPRPEDSRGLYLPILACKALPVALKLARLADQAAVGLAVIPGARKDLPGDDYEPGLVQLVTRDAVLTSTIPEGRYPRYQDVWPEGEPLARFRLAQADRLAVLLGTAVAATDSDSTACEVTFAGGAVMIESGSAIRGRCRVSLGDVEMTGKATFAVDGRFLRDFFDLVGDGPMELAFYGPGQAVVLHSGPSFDFVIMPLTRDVPTPPKPEEPGDPEDTGPEDEGGGVVVADPEPGPAAPVAVTPDAHEGNGEAAPRRRRRK